MTSANAASADASTVATAAAVTVAAAPDNTTVRSGATTRWDVRVVAMVHGTPTTSPGAEDEDSAEFADAAAGSSSSNNNNNPTGLAYRILVGNQDVTTVSSVSEVVLRQPHEVVHLHEKLVAAAGSLLDTHGIMLPEQLRVKTPDDSNVLSSHLLIDRARLDVLQGYLRAIVDVPELATLSVVREFLLPPPVETTAATVSASPGGSLCQTSTVPTQTQIEDVFPHVGPHSFQKLKVLGQGSMGKVVLVRKIDSRRLYALKIIRKEWVIMQKEVVHTKAERDILVAVTQSRNPFLVTLYHSFQTTRDLYLVLEYCPGGDLATQLAQQRKLNLVATTLYAAEIVLGLEELHRMGIIYRDLKPENILIDKLGHVVLSDFGLSKQFPTSAAPFTRTFCGTTDYLAPEILRGEEYSYAVDWWSLGALIYEMLVGITPFYHSNHQELYRRVLEARVTFPATLEPSAKHIIAQLLERDPTMRLGRRLNGVKEIKSQAFFMNIDWRKALRRQLEPRFVPKLVSPDDVSHFDSDFTNLPVDDDDGLLPPPPPITPKQPVTPGSLSSAEPGIRVATVPSTAVSDVVATSGNPEHGDASQEVVPEPEPSSPFGTDKKSFDTTAQLGESGTARGEHTAIDADLISARPAPTRNEPSDMDQYFVGFSYDAEQDSVLQNVSSSSSRRFHYRSSSSVSSSPGSSGSGNGGSIGSPRGRGHHVHRPASNSSPAQTAAFARRPNSTASFDGSYDSFGTPSPPSATDGRGGVRSTGVDGGPSSGSGSSSLDDMTTFKRNVLASKPPGSGEVAARSISDVHQRPLMPLVISKNDWTPPVNLSQLPATRFATRSQAPGAPVLSSPRSTTFQSSNLAAIPSSPRSPRSDFDFQGDGYDGNIVLESPRPDTDASRKRFSDFDHSSLSPPT